MHLGRSGPDFSGELNQHELFWRDHQPWLRECGYLVRARYSPDWKPSWEGTGKHFAWCEDGVLIHHPAILDATRLSDGKMVSLKKVVRSVHPYEADIAQFLSSKPLSRDARNHCVPIYEVLKVPSDNNTVILVMPFLRQFDDPEFQTVGEVVELCQQLFEGLRFMHENRVAHRDISTLNVMMDPAPMFPNLYHPIRTYMKRDFSGRVRFHYSRTERPTRYFYVDFGLSRRYGPDDNDPQELPILGGNKTVPEFQQEGYDMPSNPFCTDIYYLGDLIRDSFLKEYNGLEFMDALVSDMVQDDPRARPTMDVVVARFNAIRDSLSTWKLRSPLMKREHIFLVRIFISLRHICRTVSYIMKRLPPVASSSLTDINKSTGEAVSPKINEAVAPADEVVH
ncbi:hypothetical protein WOLCODRAFT_91811 [Wolfiporia cocos MD-104 SS10]|uniref:Protein kinase domain-containing protein n=1 Tax=Wolfiporia cocos (strain MD-104) TaxID=742152 RepID=A0A2H3JBC2_WOLCO|nr:hypothetical protein WOLCODRAFT_91811 [Wolfiporia cocos MD-104 SS10]